MFFGKYVLTGGFDKIYRGNETLRRAACYRKGIVCMGHLFASERDASYCKQIVPGRYQTLSKFGL